MKDWEGSVLESMFGEYKKSLFCEAERGRSIDRSGRMLYQVLKYGRRGRVELLGILTKVKKKFCCLWEIDDDKITTKLL